MRQSLTCEYLPCWASRTFFTRMFNFCGCNCAGRSLSLGWVQSASSHQGSQIGSMKPFAIHNYFHNTCWINLKINILKCEESLTIKILTNGRRKEKLAVPSLDLGMFLCPLVIYKFCMRGNGASEKWGAIGDVMVKAFVKTPNLQPSALPAVTLKPQMFWILSLCKLDTMS